MAPEYEQRRCDNVDNANMVEPKQNHQLLGGTHRKKEFLNAVNAREKSKFKSSTFTAKQANKTARMYIKLFASITTIPLTFQSGWPKANTILS